MNHLSSEQKKKIIKSVVILALVIVVFSWISRHGINGGQTLSQYAQDRENAEGPIPTATPQVNEPASTDSVSTVPVASEETDVAKPEDTPTTISPERTSYKDGFYYEPLSEELITYITGVSYPAEGTTDIAYEDLVYLHVLHYNFEAEEAEGELICNKAIAADLVEIFYELYLSQYQIEKMQLMEIYNGDDEASMADNNTSCFNYRPVAGSEKLSRHAYGLAVDINPFYNPYVRYDGNGGELVQPQAAEAYADRSNAFPYKIDTDDLCYRLFTEHGFTWGGNWNSAKDYQHFQKQP